MDIRLAEWFAVDRDDALVLPDRLAGQADHALDHHVSGAAEPGDPRRPMEGDDVAATGVRNDLTLTEARALCPGLVNFEHDPVADRRSVVQRDHRGDGGDVPTGRAVLDRHLRAQLAQRLLVRVGRALAGDEFGAVEYVLCRDWFAHNPRVTCQQSRNLLLAFLRLE